VRRYRSKFENGIGDKLGEAAEYEPIVIKFTQPAKKRTYTPDFVLRNGIIIESKGRLTAADRAKMLLVKADNPELDIRFVFQRASNRISKASKTTYAAWCDANGFRWAEKEVPAAWLAETIVKST
jgi:hypothetical protein